MGTIGGGVFQAIKGFRNAPAGVGHRLRGSANAVRVRAPQIGGSFAIWGGLFSTVDCGLIFIPLTGSAPLILPADHRGSGDALVSSSLHRYVPAWI
ncbi:hypothetical protein F7725_001253 [Dissostichus mawsoni]|uniref:Uncharacterized protein n=1 Tax=Dissostichus mawsoni TaxID=36200 RepID=A0A7J5ZKV1_DISMA|nr:hypothetical protein F7725_001253 [Dissostichus mawsoni]